MEEGCVWRCVNSAHNGDVRQDDEPEHRESAHLALSMGNAEFEQAPCNIEGPGIDSELSPGRCFTGCVGWHSSSQSRIIMWSFDHPHRSLGTPDAKKHVGLGVREERAGSGRRNSGLPTSHTFCLLCVDVSHCHEVSHRPMTCQPFTTDASRRARALQVLEP